MLSYHAPRRWAARLALFSVLVPMFGLGAGPAHASPADVDVAAFAGQPGAETVTATGKVGDVVKVTVGIYNKGPGKVQWKGFSGAVKTWTFTLPPGTETVAGPAGEKPLWGWSGLGFPDSCKNTTGASGTAAEPFGAGPYDCMSSASLEAGAKSETTFHLKINKVIPNASGKVNLDTDLKWPATGEESLADSNADNDEASVIINPDPNVKAVVAGVPVTRTALGAALLLLLAMGGGLFLYRRRRAH